MSKNKSIIISLGLIILTLFSSTILLSTRSHATDNTDIVDEINITVPISCTMSGTGMTSHNANMTNGSYTPNIGTTTLKVFCNDTEGFAIFAAGYTGDEIGGTNSTKLVNSASQVDNTISTGTATSGNTSNWAMKLATNTSATYAVTLDNGFGAYSSVPNSYTKVAHRDSGTDIGTGATGAELTTTYAAFVNQTQPAGTYIGKVIYTLVHPSNETPVQPVACEAGKICYNANAGNVEGQMGKQTPTGYQINNGFSIWAPNYKRNGYGFAGWNDKFDYSGNFYGPNETITAPSDIQTNGLSLYAVWIKSAGSLQNWNGCSSLDQGAVTALTDTRDNDTYAIAKLADDKCWIIENLRLDDGPELSESNTHNPSLPLTNIYDTSITSNHLSPSDSNDWCYVQNSSVCYDQSKLRTDNTTLFINNTSSSYSASSNVYSYGNYYNWYSATAGNGKYQNTGAGDGFAVGDICPAGWHLPKGTINGEYYALNSVINNGATNSNASNKLRSYPNNFVYSGIASSSSGRNSSAEYWSAAGSPNTGNLNIAYTFGLGNSSVVPGTRSLGKSYGATVRCIADV